VPNCEVTPSHKSAQSAYSKANRAKTEARLLTATVAVVAFFYIALRGLRSIEHDQKPHVLFGLSFSSCVAVVALSAALWTSDKPNRLISILLLLAALPIAVLSVADLFLSAQGLSTGLVRILFDPLTLWVGFWFAFAALLRSKRHFTRPNPQRLR
jgi:hypothetical protein